jgi:hypothetical protein
MNRSCTLPCELDVRQQLSLARKGRPARLVPLKTRSSRRVVPMMPAVERALVEQLEVEQRAGRGRDGDLAGSSPAGGTTFLRGGRTAPVAPQGGRS